MEYSFWMVWGRTFESNERWHMVRTPSDWTSYDVEERVRAGMSGGVGDDMAEFLRVEEGWDDGLWNDYVED
jgi:hypothetical protein